MMARSPLTRTLPLRRSKSSTAGGPRGCWYLPHRRRSNNASTRNRKLIMTRYMQVSIDLRNTSNNTATVKRRKLFCDFRQHSLLQHFLRRPHRHELFALRAQEARLSAREPLRVTQCSARQTRFCVHERCEVSKKQHKTYQQPRLAYVDF